MKRYGTPQKNLSHAVTRACGDESELQIFISYRNADEPFGAALLDHVLSARFGPARIFRAAKSIRPGEDYVEALVNGVRRSAALLVVIGPRWSVSADPAECWPGSIDWVRHEIAEAFRLGIRVIPILLDVDPPIEAELPPDIAPLARCQYVRIRHRNSWSDIDYLAQELAALVPSLVVAGVPAHLAAG